MTRRCSHCSNNGHNSRTCPTRGGCSGGVKLFGVRLIDGTIMKKSASMSSLSAHIHSPSSSPLNPGSPSLDPVTVAGGYLSDDLAHGMCSSNRRAERKKGVPWTEEEHRLFLIGLHKLGKGDWRGIARNYVTSRTPTQVASHAQKYFIRQTNVGRRKRRSSLFDMSADVEIETPLMAEESVLPLPHQTEHDNSNPLPSLNLSLTSDFISMENSPSPDPPKPPQTEETTMETQATFPFFLPLSSPLPISFPVWPAIVIEEEAAAASPHQVLKPIPLLPKQPVNVDALVGMSHLSLVEARESSPLSLKLLGEPSRQSAFHVKASGRGKTSPIQAV